MWVCRCEVHVGGDGAGEVEVVAAEKGDPGAAGAGEALVPGVVDAAIGLGVEVEVGCGLGSEDVEGGVGGGTVDDEVLEVGIDLLLDAVEAGLQGFCGVPGRRDDCDERAISGGRQLRFP